jgi:hypothetical protein
MRCTQGFKRVRSKFGGTVRRCKGFGGRKRSTSYRSRRRKRGMATRGSRCTGGMKRVRSVLGGTVLRCRSFGGRKASGRKRTSRSRYKKGRRPYNKGKKCVAWGRNKLGRQSCVSYGGGKTGYGSPANRARRAAIGKSTNANRVAAAYANSLRAGSRYTTGASGGRPIPGGGYIGSGIFG